MTADKGSGIPAASWASEKLKEFYFAVGVAITLWQSVEFELTQLFCILVRAEDGAASAVFNAVPSFPTKLRMVKAAAAVRLTKSNLFEPCIKLCKHLEAVAKKRDQLAHFTLIKELPNERDLEKLAKGLDLYLAPTPFDGARNWRHKGNPPRLKLAEIRSRATEFNDVSEKIRGFSEQVEAALKSRPSQP